MSERMDPTMLTEQPIHTTALRKRPRRLRAHSVLRDSVAETQVAARDFILPFFVLPGTAREETIDSLPGVSRFSVEPLLRRLEQALKLGVRAFMFFGVLPEESKDETAESAADPEGPVPAAIRAARRAFGNEVVLYSDVCLCAHTSHGHCGLLKHTPRGVIIDNDATLPQLAAMAGVHAEAGVDFVSPSDMMDGRVGYLRESLDAAGYSETGILAYAVKYASAFYGPFREAAHSSPSFGDRSSYQMDYRNAGEALREIALDEDEGADLLMVKPAMPYLDVLGAVRQHTRLPLAAYQVSGEYAMLKAASRAEVFEEPRAVRESLYAIKRAGADLIVTYYALEALDKGWI